MPAGLGALLSAGGRGAVHMGGVVHGHVLRGILNGLLARLIAEVQEGKERKLREVQIPLDTEINQREFLKAKQDIDSFITPRYYILLGIFASGCLVWSCYEYLHYILLASGYTCTLVQSMLVARFVFIFNIIMIFFIVVIHGTNAAKNKLLDDPYSASDLDKKTVIKKASRRSSTSKVGQVSLASSTNVSPVGGNAVINSHDEFHQRVRSSVSMPVPVVARSPSVSSYTSMHNIPGQLPGGGRSKDQNDPNNQWAFLY